MIALNKNAKSETRRRGDYQAERGPGVTSQKICRKLYIVERANLDGGEEG